MRKVLQTAYQELADEFSVSVLIGIAMLCFLVSVLAITVLLLAGVVGVFWSAFHSM